MNLHFLCINSVDFQGHGYSEGERALILSHDDLVEDLISFINNFRNSEDYSHNFISCNLDDSTKQLLRQLPFFIMGQSMGGGVVSLASIKLSSYLNYIGSVLLAPFLGDANVPHWIVLAILKQTVIPCFPNYQMPEWLDGTADPR